MVPVVVIVITTTASISVSLVVMEQLDKVTQVVMLRVMNQLLVVVVLAGQVVLQRVG